MEINQTGPGELALTIFHFCIHLITLVQPAKKKVMISRNYESSIVEL